MKFLALLTPTAQRTLAEFGPYLVEEEQVVWESYRTGSLREFYFQPSPPVVSLVYEAENAAAVDAELDLLPMIKAGLLDRRVVQLGPWLPLEVVFDKQLMPSV
ncbi:hypothetical protein SAMN05445871_4968 [Paraburkholderia caballeronis]|uniref:Superoxide dismutase n=2 Tax=Paraburkholderia caballeronis TaxID=416943 RepID=A0A1H7VVD3_9BURK|nr:hypothetical protein C7403_12754 [Paraburkholderia caballeronis]PXW93483.1 hypothetical protein C7407_12754 [Paraburkholderia caballeronis]RAJ88342.1 hypothetical protein C7409_12754 [Paraburkholderia caballeronis]TDV33805.1 hypothetical protein C7405_11056 [Paraburkholderia caballeronis]SEE22794.1 hypothetical protein SAMN05445871_4968 [Paraburkholderia caballeronis]